MTGSSGTRPGSLPGSRPHRLIMVAGTATEIGKTWVSAELLGALSAQGWTVAARKPAQSGDPGVPTDADVLAAATGESADVVCLPNRSYRVPMAPPMAAEATGEPPPTIAELVAEQCGDGFRSWGPRAPDVGVIELAGGVASPAAIDGDGADLAAAVAPDGVILVADAELGTINSVRLAMMRLSIATASNPPDLMVFLNRYDGDTDLHVRNRDWLATRDGFAVTTDLAELMAWTIGLAPEFCGSCGKGSDECDGSCSRPLDPDRYCVRCGRRLVVSISPAGHSSRCKVHGPR